MLDKTTLMINCHYSVCVIYDLSKAGRPTQLTLKIFVCMMEIVGVQTIQFLHPIISGRTRKTLTILVLRISCVLHRS